LTASHSSRKSRADSRGTAVQHGSVKVISLKRKLVNLLRHVIHGHRGTGLFDEPFELLVRLSFGHTRHLSYLGARQPALPIVLDLLPYRV